MRHTRKPSELVNDGIEAHVRDRRDTGSSSCSVAYLRRHLETASCRCGRVTDIAARDEVDTSSTMDQS